VERVNRRWSVTRGGIKITVNTLLSTAYVCAARQACVAALCPVGLTIDALHQMCCPLAFFMNILYDIDKFWSYF
jgi:hypothetical protein